MDVSILIEFVEGKLNIDDFVWLLLKDEQLCDAIRRDYANRLKSEMISGTNNDNIIAKIRGYNTGSIAGAYEIYCIIKNYLDRNNYQYNPRNDYKDKFLFLLDIQPDYLANSVAIERFLEENIIKSMPEGLNKSKQIQYCRKQLREFFRYEKSYPKWLQNAEWPIDKTGKPMVFKNQERKKEGSFLKCYYYFHSPETGETVVVEQYD